MATLLYNSLPLKLVDVLHQPLKMLKRKLIALDHPNPEEFDEHGKWQCSIQHVFRILFQSFFFLSDETEFRSAVMWLEDQKIRHYKVEDRDALRNFADPNWNETFKTYQNDLGSPVIDSSPTEQLTWLASFAIRLEYSDNG